MALIPSGTKATHCGALVVWMKVAYLTSLHGLSSHKMARITSDCDAMRAPGQKMALITSDSSAQVTYLTSCPDAEKGDDKCANWELQVNGRRRDCHFAALPSSFSRRFNRDGEGVPAKCAPTGRSK